LRYAAACLVLAFSLAIPAHADDMRVAEPITIGHSYTLETHGVERRINVIVPRDYDESEADYPVIVMLDGGLDQDLFLTLGIARWNQLWQRSAPAIFVGLETVDRQRELLPPTTTPEEQQRYPTAGESAQFREWLGSEVLPMVRGRYRDDGRAFLLGESAAGHFVAETWLQRPDMFDGYAAISPSLQWNGSAMATQIESMDPMSRPPLYISLADEGGPTETGIVRFVAKAGANVCFSDRRDQLVHANALHGLLPEALQYLMPTQADWLTEYGLTLRCDNRASE